MTIRCSDTPQIIREGWGEGEENFPQGGPIAEFLKAAIM